MPGILYSAIARGPTILCCKQLDNHSFGNVAESMVQNIPTSTDTRTTYSGDDQYVFHVVVKNRMIYMCAAETSFRKARAFAFLDEIINRFTGGSLIVRASSAGFMELQQDFSLVLNSQMNRFSKDEGDNITQLQSQVNEVKGVMTQNIEKVLQRGEKLDDLLNKTEDLEASAHTFQKTSRAVARKYWWQNLKMKIIIALVVLVILVAIILIILSQTGAFKSKADSSSTTSSPTTTVSSSVGS